jgi:hypothetical protein
MKTLIVNVKNTDGTVDRRTTRLHISSPDQYDASGNSRRIIAALRRCNLHRTDFREHADGTFSYGVRLSNDSFSISGNFYIE